MESIIYNLAGEGDDKSTRGINLAGNIELAGAATIRV